MRKLTSYSSKNGVRGPRLSAGGLLSVVILAACGSNSGGDGGGGGDDIDGDIPNPSGLCTTSADCEAPQVCEPTSGFCVLPGVSCESHEECVAKTYCDEASASCLPSTTGSPCATDDNCDGECIAGQCGCSGLAHERELTGLPLDIYMVLDRTGSMGNDCAYNPQTNPTAPVASKACYATYALADYLTTVSPETETKVAFNLMSLDANQSCDGSGYVPALIPSVSVPVAVNSPLVQRISDENFSGGHGTRIESAVRGIANYTTASKVEGREMIGVLITDGDATQCNTNTNTLASIVGNHYQATGIRTFIIGMTGATESNLEALAVAGGAEPHNDFCGSLEPPCHYYNVGDGSGPVLAAALDAISAQAVPLPCELDVEGLTPPEGESLDFDEINVTLTEDAEPVTLPRVPSADLCPDNQLAWYYDDPQNPTKIELCDFACDSVSEAGDGATLNVVVGCESTVVVD